MKRNKMLLAGITIAGIVIAVSPSCKKDTSTTPAPVDTPVSMTPYSLELPAFFPAITIPDDNKLYTERIELGRRLYYDPSLSNDGRSCGGCHIQSYGFTNAGTGGMPVLPHVNLAWSANFMWDGSQKGTLEDVMLFEVKDFFQANLTKINSDTTYRTLFKKYYAKNEITHKDIAYALAQFMRTMISKDSRFDRFIRGQATLTTDERKGYEIFFTEKGDCFHCHINPVTTDNLFHNTGLDSNYDNVANRGYFNVTGNPADMGKFRTPNLRNVVLRKSFMHDGRFSTLEEVIDFYDHGVHKVNTLDPIMTKPGKENGLKLTALEKAQLVAFLNTFTDSSFIFNSRFSNPR